jgi:hypothetical protein
MEGHDLHKVVSWISEFVHRESNLVKPPHRPLRSSLVQDVAFTHEDQSIKQRKSLRRWLMDRRANSLVVLVGQVK